MPGFVVVPVRVLERALGAVFLGHLVLQVGVSFCLSSSSLGFLNSAIRRLRYEPKVIPGGNREKATAEARRRRGRQKNTKDLDHGPEVLRVAQDDVPQFSASPRLCGNAVLYCFPLTENDARALAICIFCSGFFAMMSREQRRHHFALDERRLGPKALAVAHVARRIEQHLVLQDDVVLALTARARRRTSCPAFPCTGRSTPSTSGGNRGRRMLRCRRCPRTSSRRP